MHKKGKKCAIQCVLMRKMEKYAAIYEMTSSLIFCMHYIKNLHISKSFCNFVRKKIEI